MLHQWLAAGVFGVAGLVILSHLLYEMAIQLSSIGWETTTGRIYPPPDDRDSGRIAYRYRVEDTLYECDRLAAGAWLHRWHKGTLRKRREEFPAASEIELRYHPRHPECATLGAPRLGGPDRLALWLLVLACLASAYLIWNLAPPAVLNPADIRLTAEGYPIYPLPGTPLSRMGNSILRFGFAAGAIWLIFRWLRAWWWAAQSPKWPMITGKIHTINVVTVEGPRFFLILSNPRQYREVRYTYRTHEHRYENDSVTQFGSAAESMLWGTDWTLEDPLDEGGIVPVYHRPRTVGACLLLPGQSQVAGMLSWLGLQAIAAWIVFSWFWERTDLMNFYRVVHQAVEGYPG